MHLTLRTNRSALSFTFFFLKECHSVMINFIYMNVDVYTRNYTYICLSGILRDERMPFFSCHRK